MANPYYSTQPKDITSGQNVVTASGGQPINPNAGELATTPTRPRETQGTTGITPSARPVGIGAQVGIMRSLEFSAGGRAHRISTGPYTRA